MRRNKAVLSIILVAAASAAVFFTGWIQLRIPAGSYALAVSKTGGWGERLIAPGSFAWTWEALLPTNLELRCFRLRSLSEPFSARGELPQAAVYSAFIPERPSFAYSISGRVSLAPSPESLPAVIRAASLRDQTGLEEWLRGQARQAGLRAGELLGRAASAEDIVSLMDEGRDGLQARILSQLRSAFPTVVIESIEIESLSLPDYRLYTQARSLYSAYLDAKAAYLDPVIKELAENAARDEYELDSLERYGELLTRYPVLIDYLAIKRGLRPGASAGED
jgi:hypothetical protein